MQKSSLQQWASRGMFASYWRMTAIFSFLLLTLFIVTACGKGH